MESIILSALSQCTNRSPKGAGLKFKIKNKWLTYSWPDVYESVDLLAKAIDALDSSQNIVIWAHTSRFWFLTDLAIMALGKVSVPIYPNSSLDDVKKIIDEVKPTLVFIDHPSQIEILSKTYKQISFVCFREEHKSLMTFDHLLQKGQKIKGPKLDARIQKIKPDVPVTIIYTSGTTGKPRGVVLSHKQINSEIEDLSKSALITEKDCFLSFLPYAHIVGRTESFLALFTGATLAFAEEVEHLRADLKVVRPSILVAVPRVIEKIGLSLDTKMKLDLFRFRIFDRAAQLRSVFFKGPQRQVGSNLRFIISGGAALPKSTAEYFFRLGILILEGYGLTETTGAITLNTQIAHRFGTVGKPLGHTEIKLASDGEILVRSPKVMEGYYKDPTGTKESITQDGFFKTGDIGELSEDGFLTITDRKRDLIKTSLGKFVAPQKLVQLFSSHPLISNVLIYGENQKYIVALVTLHKLRVMKIAKEMKLSFQDYPSLLKLEAVQKIVREIVAEVNAHLSPHETIKNFAILPKDFSVKNGELTPSLKIRRKFCGEKYGEAIARLYN